MATGDVTTFGPYQTANLSSVKTDLEAASVAAADNVTTAYVDGQFYVIVIES